MHLSDNRLTMTRRLAILLVQGLLVPALGCSGDEPATGTETGAAQGVDAGPADAGPGGPTTDSGARAPGMDASSDSLGPDAAGPAADAGRDATLAAAVAQIDAAVDAAVPESADASAPGCRNDSYEENDQVATSAKLILSAAGAASVDATSFPSDHDFFEIVVPRHDPVRLTGSYTVPDGSAADLYVNFSAAGRTLGANGNVRTGATENWDSWLGPDLAGGAVQVDVWQNIVGGCVPYQLTLDTNACTDAFEDNDTLDTAQTLPVAQVHQVTIISGDEDDYLLTALGHAGVCTLRYGVPAGSTQKLNATLRDSAGLHVITQGQTVAEGEQRTLTVAWNNAAYAAGVLQLIPTARECTPYTIECVAQ